MKFSTFNDPRKPLKRTQIERKFVKGEENKPSLPRLSGLRRSGRRKLKAKPESKEAKEFKRAVRERDDYTCQRCFKVQDKHIHVHHIAPRSRRPDLKLVVSNGICLDWECHSWVHSHVIEATELGLLSTEAYETRAA